MRSAGRALAFASVVFFLGACQSPLSKCRKDADCPGGAVCRYELCVAAARPNVVLALDRRSAAVGEAVRVDASASTAPGGGELAFEFRVEPEGAATVEPDGARATVRPAVPHLDLVVIVTARTPDGAEAEAQAAIAARNRPPTVTLEAIDEPFEPGQPVRLVAKATDPDGDALALEWSLEEGAGSLEAAGADATLQTDPTRKDASYPVRVVVQDGHGGQTTASLTLQPENRAPRLTAPAASADHWCDGEPLGCHALVPLAVEAEDANGVELAFRLVDPPDSIEHLFEEKDGVPTLRLSCTPACPIAGDYTVEVTATDRFGAASSVEMQVAVRNRPPVVCSHDGAAVPHTAEMVGAVAIYRVFRRGGEVITYQDPDGDPPNSLATQWSTSSGILEFSAPTSLSTDVEAIGSLYEIIALDLALYAEDINGASGSDSTILPIGNSPPVVSWAGITEPGHQFVRTEESERVIIRKLISTDSLVVVDEDGDPLNITFDVVNEEPGLEVVEFDGEFYLQGASDAMLGRAHDVIARATDSLNASSAATAQVYVSNRPPVIVFGGLDRVLATGRQCETLSCCIVNAGGWGCDGYSNARVATRWGGVSGALQVSETARVLDPDGDPVHLDVSFDASKDAHPQVLTATGWKQQATLACTEEGAEWACPLTVRLRGSAGEGPAQCAIDGGTNLGAATEVVLRAVDELGGQSTEERLSLEARDDAQEGSCP